MHVAAQRPSLAAHDEGHLRVGLVPHDPVDHVGPGLLQGLRELDVRLLVEAGAQLDHDRDLLPLPRRVHEGLHHRRVRPRAVEGLADRQHVRIARRLAQEVHDRREGLEGMVQEQVPAADHVEEVVVATDALRDPGDEARVLEVRPVDHVRDGHHPREVHGAVAAVDVRLLELELTHEERLHFLRAVVREFEAHLVPEATGRQLALQGALEIVDLLLVDEEVRVAGHPELVAARGLHAREQVAHVLVDDRGEEHEVRGPARDGLGKLHEPRQGARGADDGHAAVAPEGVLALEGDDEVQALVEHPREGMRRVEGDGAQHRGELPREVALDPGGLAPVPLAAADEADVLRVQARNQHLVQDPVLLVHEGMADLRDAPELIRRAEVVGAALRGAVGDLLLEPGDADLEELVEVRGRDAQEAQAFEERDALVLRLLEHATVELEQGEFPVDVEFRACEVDRVHGVRERLQNGSGSMAEAERFLMTTTVAASP